MKENIIDGHVQGKAPIFPLSQCFDMYEEELKKNGIVDPCVNKTRFKEKLLHTTSGLIELKSGRQVSLQINEDAGKALYEAANSAQGIEKTRKIREVAKIIREDLLTNDEIFNCDASLQKQLDCIPSNLLYMLQMIVSGAPSEDGSDKQIDNIVLCIAQLIRYNTVKNKRDKNAIIVRHRADNEPPFPTLLGMIVHATTRSKTMVDYLNWHGLTPGYQRVKCIRRSIANRYATRTMNWAMCVHLHSKNLFSRYSL